MDRLALFEPAHGARFEALTPLADDVYSLAIVTHTADNRHVLIALLAGARATDVRGAILADGPGLAGGGPTPPAASIATSIGAPPPGGTPDPWALHELTRDVRPPDYASTYARLASVNSGLDVAIAVVGVNRPPWLEAVVQEPGVVECSLPEALERFADAD